MKPLMALVLLLTVLTLASAAPVSGNDKATRRSSSTIHSKISEHQCPPFLPCYHPNEVCNIRESPANCAICVCLTGPNNQNAVLDWICLLVQLQIISDPCSAQWTSPISGGSDTEKPHGPPRRAAIDAPLSKDIEPIPRQLNSHQLCRDTNVQCQIIGGYADCILCVYIVNYPTGPRQELDWICLGIQLGFLTDPCQSKRDGLAMHAKSAAGLVGFHGGIAADDREALDHVLAMMNAHTSNATRISYA